jgi:putative transposase
MPNQFTCYRWRKEFGGLKTDQVKRLKELESEASNATGSREMPNNERLGKAVSDLTLEKLILRGEAHRPNALGNFVRHCA